MKLRNKKTGDIAEVLTDSIAVNVSIIRNDLIGDMTGYYTSLAELNEEWEDYDDTKDCWCISYIGSVKQYREYVTGEDVELCKQIGNYFETREEAEKAVEKLKAWKRLKNKGFEFTGWDRHPDFPGDFRITASDEYTCDDKDLDLLFGGEE